ncbi:MAG TPA: amidase [Pyrinomonadaceae bacterium]|nr:amidase [Pyrinomonadaceae bacterium]
MSELIFQTATCIAKLIRERAVSPLEVLEAHLRRIDEFNPKLNALVTLVPDAFEKAEKAEAALVAGHGTGPLCGLPFTVKDTIETGSLRTTSGCPARKHFVPNSDAPAVARLKAAGAIILGKTNPAEMAMDYTADNPVFGRTNNPYDLRRSPGGSSGGEAAAIAACLSPCGLGSDLAGSIRIPAHFCGIAGLKPSTGRVPGEGQFPPSIGPYSLGAVIGPMGRCIEDLQLLFRVLTGSDSSGGSGDNRKRIQGWRVAWYAEDGVAPVTEETRQAVAAAAGALVEAGLIVEERLPPAIGRGHELWLKIFSRASVVQLREVYAGHETEAGSFVRWRLETADDGLVPGLDEYISAWMERDRLRMSLLNWMRDVPLLVAPVGATPAVPHDVHKVTVGGQTINEFRAFSYSQAFNTFDLPAVCVPASKTAEGLPIGVQIVGRPFAEEFVLAAAGIVEKALGGWRLSDKF